jgi:hypothetical protein
MLDRRLIELMVVSLQAKGVLAWVDSYDGGEDDEKVIKVMLPMLAIAVLACVMGYYIKNKFFKDDEEKNEKQKNEEKKTRDMKFPTQHKANKPWLTNGVQPAGPGRVNNQPIGPTGGYEYTLPGYHQAVTSKPATTTKAATEKRTQSQQSAKSGSSGYQSHTTGVQHVSEKRSNYNRHAPTGRSSGGHSSQHRNQQRSSQQSSRPRADPRSGYQSHNPQRSRGGHHTGGHHGRS